jgi:hypothetical protein
MGSGLSWREHLILARIEDDLRADHELDRALTAMRVPRARRRPVRLCGRAPAGLLALLAAVALGLATIVAQVPTAALAFLTLVWGITLLTSAAKAATHRRDRREAAPGTHPR